MSTSSIVAIVGGIVSVAVAYAPGGSAAAAANCLVFTVVGVIACVWGFD